MIPRSSGVLLHPTSLPGPYGIGDLGPAAFEWIDYLAECGFSWWQCLPIGPTGFGHSPYQSYSSFAGNPLLVSLDWLVEQGLLSTDEVNPPSPFPKDQVDFARLIPYKEPLLALAAQRFLEGSPSNRELESFQRSSALWLPDFALFMALKAQHGQQAWLHWDPELRDRQAEALERARLELVREIQFHTVIQFFFDQQWSRLREYAKSKRVGLIGDLPIYVAHDSVDVWTNRRLFQLEPDGRLSAQAGVPPDYFTETGQLWGNPLYTWERHAEEGYAWWLQRLAHSLSAFDYLRLDHFRGFAGYWSVPADHETAMHGRWMPGPSHDFFRAMQAKLENFSIIAEDLGEITPDVIQLRDAFNLPSMKILQFAFFEDMEHEFLPHNHPENAVVYTGTHDHDTSRSWFEQADPYPRNFALHYLHATEETVIAQMVAAAFKSVASLAVIPMQDLLDLGNEARMNEPGTLDGNWLWRMRSEHMSTELSQRLRQLNTSTKR